MAVIRKILNPQVFAGAYNPSFSGSSTYYGDDNPAPDDAMMPANARSSVSAPKSDAFNPSSSEPNVSKDIYQPQLRDIGSRLQEAYNPPRGGVGSTLRHVLGALMSQRNPQLGSLISGDYGRQQKIAGLTKQYGLTEDAIAQDRVQKTAELSQQNIGSEIKERGRANDIRQQVADTKETPEPKTVQVGDEIKQFNPATNRFDITVGAAKTTKAEAPHTVVMGNRTYQWDDKKSKWNDIGPAKESESTGSWSLQEDPHGKPVLFNSKTGESKPAPPGVMPKGSHKANISATNRAQLADNLNENLDKLEDIANRRPELFGPLAGRWTKLKETFGTDDADIGALQTIEHQIGMVQQSTHGMRSAFGVQSAANSVLNNFKNGGNALKGSIKAARDSAKTFKNTVDEIENKGGGVKEVDPNDPEGLFTKP